MPDDRLLHRRQSHSAKLAECDHLTYRVWTQYLLSADDFGVMPDEPATIRGDNFALKRETEAQIRCSLDQIVSLGLCLRFVHQGQVYLCSAEWQDYQKVAYPRTSYLPTPSPEVFNKLSMKTRRLFGKKCKAKARDRYRLTANGLRLTAKGKRGESEGGASRAGAGPEEPSRAETPTSPGPETPATPPAAGAPPAPPAPPRAQAPPRRRATRHATLLGGPHVGHAHCDVVCVPAWLHAEFRQGLNRPEDPDGADAELRAGYSRHCEGWPPGKATGDPVRFWRAWFAATYPAPTARELRGQAEANRIEQWLHRETA